jgi:molybdopterin-guanine dinucleotide biosynthesis protein A
MMPETQGMRVYILAGGRATRIGRNKSLMTLGGEAVLAKQLRVLETLCDSVVIVANDDAPYRAFGCRVIPDIYRDAGPLGGLHAALTDLGTGRCLVLATDMPFLSAPLIRFLWHHDPSGHVVVPVKAGKLEPLHAVYAGACLDSVEMILSAGRRKILDFYPHVKTVFVEEAAWKAVEPDAACFLNINTREDLAAAVRLLEKRSRS